MRDSLPRLPVFMRLANAFAASLGRVGYDLARLRLESVHEAAMARTGLTDFGDPYYLDGLEHLLESASKEARLHGAGRLFVRELIVIYLANRLMLCEARKRAPAVFERPLVPPLIVVGLPRSGTTVLHRALAADPDHRAIPYWELMHPFARVLPSADPARLRRWIDRKLAVRSRVIPESDRQHYLRAETPEECTFMLGLTFTSLVFWMFAPVFGYLHWFLSQDRAKVYLEYRELLQILQASTERRLVLKAPEHASALGSLLAAIPEAMIVQTHRHPAEVCLSLDSILFSNHRSLVERMDTQRLAAANVELVERFVERNLAERRTFPSAVHDVLYSSVVADPLEAVKGVYDRFRLPWSPDLEARLAAHLGDNAPGKHGWHRYRASDYGQSEAALRRRFDGYLERYGLQPERRVAAVA